jgi:hypothetical protein
LLTRKSTILYAALTIGLSLPGWAQIPQGELNAGAYQPPQSFGQPFGQQPQAPDAQPLSPQQLSNLVAPIALYPDLLLSQVLAASTYPAEITQAQQWMQSNPNLRGQELIEAAKPQNWDPSVQALVAFPDVLNTLTRDIQWTTDLGNAFLAQQAGVMDAIQQLRASARNNGRLTDTPQQRLGMEPGPNGQHAIVIQPTNQQMVYPPIYNPQYVWGPPAYGAYPPLGYPDQGDGVLYAVGTFLGGLFTGLLSFGGWGWGLSWLTHGLFLNGLFFSHFGFHGGGFGGGTHMAWVHNPSHRLGVPYGNRYAGGSFGSRGFSAAQSYRGNYSGSSSFNGGRSGYAGSNFAGSSRQMEAYRGLSAGASRGGFNSNFGSGSGNYAQARYSAPAYGGARSFASAGSAGGGYRGSNYAAPAYGGARSFASAGSAGGGYRGSSYSAPRSGGRSSFSAPHYSTPKSSGHFGGGGGGHSHSGGGGGHSHSGGGGHKK